jgi:CheY-like chemotaxis protein
MTHTVIGLRPARKVLVIDDEEALCVLLARMISKLGYKVTTSNQAKSGYLAFIKLASIRIWLRAYESTH